MNTDRTPHPHRGDPVLLYGDRRTVLDLIDRGMGLLIVAEDDAGLRVERYADRLTWDADARAWRQIGRWPGAGSI